MQNSISNPVRFTRVKRSQSTMSPRSVSVNPIKLKKMVCLNAMQNPSGLIPVRSDQFGNPWGIGNLSEVTIRPERR